MFFLSKKKPDTKKKSGKPRKLLRSVQPTGVERKLQEDDIIVSKTDLKGQITYGNELFIEISGFPESELLGAPHSILRHPDMPRCIFKVLWDAIQADREVFAYAVNLCRNGDHYWVFAHVTPSFDAAHQKIGYHSMRLVARPKALQRVIPLYRDLLRIEQQHENRRNGLAASMRELEKRLTDLETTYDEFVFSL